MGIWWLTLRIRFPLVSTPQQWTPSSPQTEYTPMLASDSNDPATTEITPRIAVAFTQLTASRSRSGSGAPLLSTTTALTPNTYGATEAIPEPPWRRRRRSEPKTKLRSKVLFVFVTLLLVLCIYASFVDDFMGVVEAGIACGSCLGLLMPLQAMAHIGDDAFVDFFVGFCTKLGIEDADVCTGAVGTQAPILAHDLRSISLASHAAKNFCSTVFGLCPLQKVIPYSVNVAEYSQETPSSPQRRSINGSLSRGVGLKSSGTVWQSKGRKPIKVIHLSDVHIDREYVTGSSTTCSKHICCRNYNLDSVGPNVTHPAGRFGDQKCDTPVDLVESMLSAIDRFVPNKAFTIFTGDVCESAVWSVDEPKAQDDLHQWYEEMQPPSYPVLGNHDVAPVNSFPRSTSMFAGRSQWVFDLAASDWEKWIGKKSARQVAENSGCYSRVHPGTRLKIISINTQYWYKQNFWLYDSDEPQWDPNGILTWLEDELRSSELAGQRAWIIGHMSFGKVDALRDQSNYANQIFERYSSTIAAHFYGHSHQDEFEIGYSDYNRRTADNAIGITFISGALTPTSGNPVFRVYDVDPDTYEIMDFVPYYTNRSEPSFQKDPVWKPYYSAREVYGSALDSPLAPLDSLNATFWHRVTEKMEVDDNLFQAYIQRMSRGGRRRSCSLPGCKKRVLCMLRSMRSENNCAFIQPGIDFKNRAGTGPEPMPDDDDVGNKPIGVGSYSYSAALAKSLFSLVSIAKEDPHNADFQRERERKEIKELEEEDMACEGAGLGSLLRKIGENRMERLYQNSIKKRRSGGIVTNEVGAAEIDYFSLLQTSAEQTLEKLHARKTD